MAHAAVSSLLRTIDLEFFTSKPRPLPKHLRQILSDCKPSADSLRQSLKSVRSSLEALDGFDANGLEKLSRETESALRDIALGAEDEIETLLSETSLDGLDRALQRALEDVIRIEGELKRAVEVKDLSVRTRKLVTMDDVVPKFDSPESSSSSSSPEEKMVGKDDELRHVMDQIKSDSRRREVVSVHGMGGIGKTMLAKRVYEDTSIKERFDKRAWVVISQHHDTDQMLSRLLKSILEAGGGSSSTQMSGDDIEELIYQRLKGQRYLIVMDDVWTTKAWDDVKRCFPDDNNGSRVLLTTRIREVAEHASADNPENCSMMRFMNPEESQRLFQEKLPIMNEHPDHEFKAIGDRVVEECYGLPLAVVVAAGLFWNKNSLEEWKTIEMSLIKSLHAESSISERCSDILALSYNHLPHNLKSCFIYFGFFPKNAHLLIKNIVMFWIAEGFLEEAENNSLEKTGEKRLLELINRNLVLPGERPSSYGTISRACHVHDLLHDLSIKIARDHENLLYIVGEKRVEEYSQRNHRWITTRRESYSNPRLYACFEKCRSFLYFEEDKEAEKLARRGIFKQIMGPREHIRDMLRASQYSLRLLRVLEMSTFECLIEMDDLSRTISTLPQLRHLSFVASRPVKNFQISKARNLHSLRVSGGLDDREEAIPMFDLELVPQLRYLKCRPSLEIYPSEVEHENLHSIAWINPIQCSEQFLAKVPKVKKLSIKGEKRDYFAFYEMNLPNLALLPELESLSINCISVNIFTESHSPGRFVGYVADLKSLRKLKLSATEFLWDDLNRLSRLPKLEVLKLSFLAGKGKEWKLMKDEDEEEEEEEEEDNVVFVSLKYLLMDGSSPVKWIASSENFPRLERLILLRCGGLREIPSGFDDISTLRSIEIVDCRKSVVASAKKIEENQHDYGNSAMEVVVHKSPSNTASGDSNDSNEEASEGEEDS